MIDLTKPQILTEPVKCWVRDTEEEAWLDGWLIGIKTNKTKYRYVIADKINHKTCPDIDSMLCLQIYQYCTLTDPNKPTRRMMTQEEAVAWACTEGAVGWQVKIVNNKPIYGEPMDFSVEVTE